jgi:hypothetical protein
MWVAPGEIQSQAASTLIPFYEIDFRQRHLYFDSAPLCDHAALNLITYFTLLPMVWWCVILAGGLIDSNYGG